MPFKIIELGAMIANSSGPDIGGTALPSSYIASQSTYQNIYASPLDGFCLLLHSNGGTSRNYNVSWHLWGYDSGETVQFTLDDVSDFVTDLQTRNRLGWGQPKHNFLAIITEDLLVDWFDSERMEKVTANLILCGEVVSLTGLYGLLLDFEAYSVAQFRYSTMPNRALHSFAEYEAKVKSYARLIAERWLRLKPDMRLFLLKSYYNAVAEAGDGEANIYGLLPAFIDGLYEVFGESKIYSSRTLLGQAIAGLPRTKGRHDPHNIIVSSTTAFRTTEADTFRNYDLPFLNGSAYQGNSGYFSQVSNEFGFMHWLTMGPVQPYEVGFDNVTPANNYMTPTDTKNALITMAGIADWCWLFDFPGYTFFGQGNTTINAEYPAAIWEARAQIGI